jgi:hypothetical protein
MSQRYRRLWDGDTVPLTRIPRTGWALKFACCDCALVHRVLVQKQGVEMTLTTWRDKRATAAKRRSKKCVNP